MKMKIFSDLAGYNRNMCQHVYRYVGYGLCGYCGLTTHDPDWDTINAGYAAYRERLDSSSTIIPGGQSSQIVIEYINAFTRTRDSQGS